MFLIPVAVPALLTSIIIEVIFILGWRLKATISVGLLVGVVMSWAAYRLYIDGNSSGEIGMLAPLFGAMLVPPIMLSAIVTGVAYRGRGRSLFSQKENAEAPE